MSNFEHHQASTRKVGIIFIGVSVYLRFFERFYQSVEEFFIPDIEKTFFVFTDNLLRVVPCNVECIHVPFNDPRFIKLHKFHYIASIMDRVGDLDFIFYFDADSLLKAPIDEMMLANWFANDCSLIGVLHPWLHIRNRDKRFERDLGSAAYVSPEESDLMDYHQSSFWGGKTKLIAEMAASIRDMVDIDLSAGHTNSHMICDEVYVNRFFLSHKKELRSLETDYANPGSEYERVTATSTKRGYRFPANEIIVHDNAAQTRSWLRLDQNSCFFTHGVFAHYHKNDLAAYRSLECYRQHNPNTPIVLFSDGGDDLSQLAAHFNCIYRYADFNIGTFRNRHQKTNQYKRLERVRVACDLLYNVDWIVILEPDVECLRPPSAIPRYALSGPSRGPAWSELLQKQIEVRYPKRMRTFGLGRNYTGCGGSIFNKEAFIECFDRTTQEIFAEAALADNRILIAEDACMSFLFQFNGYDTGGWEDFTGWQTEDKTSYAFAHGNKQYYGKKSPLD